LPKKPAADGTHAWTLYQRDQCHLCDQALSVVAQMRLSPLTSVFIDNDPLLEARYGCRVPVLRDVAGRELDWPFAVTTLQHWLKSSA